MNHLQDETNEYDTRMLWNDGSKQRPTQHAYPGANSSGYHLKSITRGWNFALRIKRLPPRKSVFIRI